MIYVLRGILHIRGSVWRLDNSCGWRQGTSTRTHQTSWRGPRISERAILPGPVHKDPTTPEFFEHLWRSREIRGFSNFRALRLDIDWCETCTESCTLTSGMDMVVSLAHVHIPPSYGPVLTDRKGQSAPALNSAVSAALLALLMSHKSNHTTWNPRLLRFFNLTSLISDLYRMFWLLLTWYTWHTSSTVFEFDGGKQDWRGKSLHWRVRSILIILSRFPSDGIHKWAHVSCSDELSRVMLTIPR
jgi:hypothetical protein